MRGQTAVGGAQRNGQLQDDQEKMMNRVEKSARERRNTESVPAWTRIGGLYEGRKGANKEMVFDKVVQGGHADK